MRLLIVDDNVALADNLRELFVEEGYQVVCVQDGQAALEQADHGIDLAVVDVRLPDMSGTALLPQLRERAPDSEAIVVTANADLDSAIAAVKGGALAYLTKPVRVEELLLTVARAAERIQLRRKSEDLQRALEASERRLRKVMATVDAVIVALDANLRMDFVNEGMAEILGWTPEEVLGREFVSLLCPEENQSECRRALDEVRDRGVTSHEAEYLTSDGHTRSIQWRWSRATDEEDSTLFGIGTDVTHERELEYRMRESERLAAAGTLTAGLAHEIRNPLNAAILQLSLLSRLVRRMSEGDRAAIREPLELVQGELRRLDTLLEDFLSFARPREYKRDPVDLSLIAQQVVALERELAASLGRSLTAQLEPSLTVSGDGHALQQVLLNLLKNALESAEASVEVRLRAEGRKAILEIEDDGPGMQAEVMKRAFEPFYTTKPSGTGLGLPIVYTIVRGHEGDIEFERREAGGTRAVVELPLR